MLGYMANPDLGDEHVQEITKKNEESIDNRGWLHSGDKGSMDAHGMVRITGRYKELIIPAGGENVAPVPVEDGVKARCEAISNVMMVGDQQKFCCALVTLKAEGATGDAPGGDDLQAVACQLDPEVTKISQAVDSELVIGAIQKAIVETNKDSKCCPIAPSTIKKFTILPTDFSVETEELTPTFKLKRGFVSKKYDGVIQMLYSDENAKATYVKFVGAPELPPKEA